MKLTEKNPRYRVKFFPMLWTLIPKFDVGPGWQALIRGRNDCAFMVLLDGG